MALQVWLPLNKDFRNSGLKGPFVSATNVTFSTAGVAGNCASFNGSNSHLSFDGAVSSDANKFSYAAWVKFNNISATQCLYSQRTAVGDGYSIFLIGGKIRFDAGGNLWTTTATIAANTWIHIAVTYDGSVKKLYINGNLSSTNTATTTSNVGEKATIGGSSEGDGIANNNRLNGFLYDVRICDNAISDQDAKDLYWSKVLEFTPQWKHSGELSVLGDASGLHFPLTPHDVTLSDNAAQFNGTSSYIEFNSPNIIGGTVSMWVTIPTKPNAQRFLYYDPVSKMSIQFSSDGNIHLGGDGTSQVRYLTTGITWGQMIHIVGVWNSSRKPSAIYINGVKPSTGKTTTWTTGGTACAIGSRRNAATPDYFNGSINEVKVFASQLTVEDAKYIYHNGPSQNNWTPDEPVWLRVLHHNNPKGARFTTQEDAKNKDTADQFSKLKIFFNNDDFRRADGNYEFMAKEKLESGSTEQVFRWTQTSNPTASTVTGYKLVSQTMNAGREFGLKHNGSYAVFHNGSTWWCACGSWSEFNNGIPGFGGTVLTGYLDLYVRADKGGVPSEYIELEYIESTGTQYMDIGVTPTTTTELIVDMALTAVGANVTVAGSHYMVGTNLAGRFHMGTYQSKWHFGVGGNSAWYNFTSPTPDTNRHILRLDGVGNSYVDNNTYKINGSVTSATTIGLFCAHRFTTPSTNEYVQATKMKLYRATVKNGGSVVADLVPVKRISDSVVGVYDIIRQMFFTNVGSGTFTAGPEV